VELMDRLARALQEGSYLHSRPAETTQASRWGTGIAHCAFAHAQTGVRAPEHASQPHAWRCGMQGGHATARRAHACKVACARPWRQSAATLYMSPDWAQRKRPAANTCPCSTAPSTCAILSSRGVRHRWLRQAASIATHAVAMLQHVSVGPPATRVVRSQVQGEPLRVLIS
jgi:hypothetical protein